MILTYKIKHHRNFSAELVRAKQVAEFAVKNRDLLGLSTKHVKHFGLKSVISNQIIRKYARDKKCKTVKKCNLIIPSQSIQVNNDIAYISALKLELDISHLLKIKKINQVELNETYAFVSCTIPEQKQIVPTTTIGIDRNTTGHCCVAACPETGKVLKLGKSAQHIQKKYKNIRTNLQKKKQFKKLKQTKGRQFNKIRDLNHKISKKVVDYAVKNNSQIILEDLKSIRKTKKNTKSFRYTLNSWSYYQLEQFIIYKAKLQGVPVHKIDPAYTSQQCSRCGFLGARNSKQFKCSCGYIEHADVNAAFVIALRYLGTIQLPVASETGKGSTDTPKRQRRKKARRP